MSTHSNKNYWTALTPNIRPKEHSSYLTCEVLIKISLSSFVFCQRCGKMKNWQKAKSVADYIADQTHRWSSYCNKPEQMYQILWWKTSISRWQSVLHFSLFRHKSQLAILESNQGELKGQKQIYINLSVCFYPAYILLNAEGSRCGKPLGLTARSRRKVKKVSWENKMYKYEIYTIETNKINCKSKSKRSSSNNRTQHILFLAPRASMLLLNVTYNM